MPGWDGTGTAERSYPASEVRGNYERSYPTSETRGHSREEQPHAQGALAVRAQEGLEELSHKRAAVRRYPSSKVRSSGCVLVEQP